MSPKSNRTAKEQIEQALITSGTMTEGEANAARIFKGFDAGTGENGWHVEPFGKVAYYVGATIAEAVETIHAKLAGGVV
jgi:hypothetical protein